MLFEPLQTAGSPLSTGITPLPSILWTPPTPSRLPSISGVSGYTIFCSADFSSGRGGSLQLLSVSLPSCCRFYPARVKTAASVSLRRSMLLSPSGFEGSAPWASHFRGHICVHFRYGPMTCLTILKMVLSIGSENSIPLLPLSKLRALTFTSWVYLPLYTLAFPGRTTGRADLPHPALEKTHAIAEAMHVTPSATSENNWELSGLSPISLSSSLLASAFN